MRSKIFTRTVGYWPLQESSGSALDYSGNEYHASTTNVSSYGVSGPLSGSSMEFDGSSDEVVVPDLSLSGSNTIAMWAKASSTRTLFGDANTGSGWFMSVDDGSEFSNGVLKFGFNDGTGNAGGTTDVRGTWHFLVGVLRDGTEEVWVDGIREGTKSGKSWYDAGKPAIGSANGGGYIDARIAHARVWDYPLPEASIRALYNASKGGFSESDSRTL